MNLLRDIQTQTPCVHFVYTSLDAGRAHVTGDLSQYKLRLLYEDP